MCVCVYHTTSSLSIISGYLDCIHVLAIVNSAAVNFGMYVLVSIIVFSRYMCRNGILNHMVTLVL